MNIAIIDADLIGRYKHRFPNLACMKLSGYYKELNHSVVLKTDYNNLENYDKVFISKVFTDTPVPDFIFNFTNISCGGTGFYYDKAPKLPEEIEHHSPDYHLYDSWVEEKIRLGDKKSNYTYYIDYSIGFMTRGCFRKCSFCVNKNYNKVEPHSPLNEFVDPSRKKICLLDDNFFGCPNWKEMLLTLQASNKPFQFKQGLDERLLTEEKCKLLFNSKYDGDYIFAFDNIEDYELIRQKLNLIRRYSLSEHIKFYVLVGFKNTDLEDIVDMWKRIKLLMSYHCFPYIMRYQNKNDKPYESSKYKGIYVAVARWCNQPRLFKKKSFREFCMQDQSSIKTNGVLCAAMKAMNEFELYHPDIARQYFDIKFDDFDANGAKINTKEGDSVAL